MNRILPRGATAMTFCGFLGVAFAGCLDRDVVSRSPTVNTIVSHTVENRQIDKIDLLFVIDNSASMGDKQQYLAQAVPQLITRLVTPNCVDPVAGTIFGPSDPAGNGTCAKGQVEFPPVHDMHIGVLSTSLGARLSDVFQPTPKTRKGEGLQCDPAATVMVGGVQISAGNDDRGELLNRSGAAQVPLADAGTSFYLNWFPSGNAANAGKSPSPGAPAISSSTQLITDFTSLIQGVGNYGCGIESQLESWYRFLVQPDPYDALVLDSSGRAGWSGVDAKLLKQRHDFLRPDSLVAIVDMTDENDSEIDVRSYGGQGYAFMATNFDPARGDSSCAENAAGSGLVDPRTCQSCNLDPNAGADPSCKEGDYGNGNDWGFNPNLRHVHMTQKYGAVPQFPIQRYALGLSSTTVPDRNGEYPSPGDYQGLTHLDCVNPLFAGSLPDGSSTDPDTLCKLPPGPRTPDLVYYAHIGGVPHQLLQQEPGNPDSPQKETLTASDWTKILGNDPLHQDYTGIDPHMIESYQPRAGLPQGPGATPDPASGYDWTTDQGAQHVLLVDREYACTFPLDVPRDCTDTTDPAVAFACDCPAKPGLSPQQLPPICNPSTPTQQVAAKAYPTERELLLAKLMGNQAFVSSLCPIHVQPASGLTQTTDPLFGYNPAVNGIVDRLKVALTSQCSTQKLVADSAGKVSCLVLVALPEGSGGAGTSCNRPGAACDATRGLLGPSSDPAELFHQSLLDTFCAEHTGAGADPRISASQPVCALQQVIVDASNTQSCATSAKPGWCYVQGPAATALHCAQPNTIEFTSDEPPSGAIVSLQCLESAVSVTGDDGGGG